MLLYISAFSFAVAISAALTYCVRGLALRRGWSEPPRSARDLHVSAVPRLGGVPIFATVVIVTVSAALMTGETTGFALTVGPILAGAAIVFIAGLTDDFRSIGPWSKIVPEVAGALILFGSGLRVERLDLLFGSRHLDTSLSLVLTVFWVLLVTNAVNLIDGLDGLAAGSTVVTVSVLCIAAGLNGQQPILLLGVVLSGALIGFLRFNLNPATIFLGDCGSLFLGFTLSAVALASSQKAVVGLAVSAVALSVPLADALLAILRRFLNGMPIFSPDRDHIHHKLLQRGWSQKRAAIALYLASALFGMLSLMLLRPGVLSISVVLLVAGAAITIGLARLRYHEIEELLGLLRRTLKQRSVITNNLAIRRGIEMLNRAHTMSDVSTALGIALAGNVFDEVELTTVVGRKSLPVEMLRPFKPVSPTEVRLSVARSTRMHETECTCYQATWSLDIDLVRDGVPAARLRLCRERMNNMVLVDMHLLTTEFAIAVLGALDRALSNAAWQHRLAQRAGEAVYLRAA